jgi:hypothetical protein
MDPNETLRMILEKSHKILANTDMDDPNLAEQAILADDLAEAITNLHEWICKGGFLPNMWRRAK